MSYQPLKLQHTVEVEPVHENYAPPSPIRPEHQEFHDFAFNPTSPSPALAFGGTSHQLTNEPRTIKHAPTWSSSTNTTAVTSEISSLQSDGKTKSGRKAVLSRNDTWTFEILALIVALAAVAAIIGVVFRYNGRALPDWPHDITLNALIALLATFANATISVCLSSGISQAKWIRFKQSAAPLSDMEAFDDASRGSWGSMKLLATARGGSLGTFGAIIAVVGLALGPFAQQIATYKVRDVESDIGAIIPRALNYTGALVGNTSSTGYVPILPLKAAVYNGLFAENNRPAASLPFTCQSGNCAWEAFETLAVCQECTDISSLVTRYCPPEMGASPNMSTCGWQVPQGAHLNTSSDVFSMTSFIPSAYGDMPHSTMVRIIFMGTEKHDVADAVNPWAKQCSLQACVNTLASSVTNGILQENITHTVLNRTVVDISSPGDSDYGVYIKGDSKEPYLLGMGALLSIRGWFSAIFTNGSATRTTSDFSRSITDSDRAVVVNLTVGVSSGETFFDTDIVTAFYWNYYEYPRGIDMLMSDLAVSMTTAFRGFMGAVPTNGTSITTESYVHVRWGFAVLPIAVVVACLVFLLAAMAMTRTSKTQLWKSSALAALFHGLDKETRERFHGEDGLHMKKRQAKAVKVRLYTDSRDETLLGSPQMSEETGPKLRRWRRNTQA
ncbi:hypothetical protein HBI56_066240 [Parastagonospora nodorum]|uniref:Uncharacterized protein n=2 Tax=Phaeosphaeria nodorum (strain SN15 / ATCC MYA-4574 / FGSC 10173) TaxID=321614 RepID=A0A7U2ENG0_PHANO|nr:hypothetical protein SNOG_09502 [Parastagonospora nodorum SN15]KAH3920173.1 hypothetical protein HBH56_000830 [Parastagonospora nodorum]EAT82767.1 hypothetical protein SNOG_09502 [Parastagonospora nodorum SN15]KAH3937805.1 hypothetical protein HBH54_000840 [Parastagonospora nodorum]KAH3940863.1 hypothetical protein HBH53_210150 [Parastagonospora nodorum]KAH3958457.1 hypothetical protein HBH51_208670 [Parastagonospora nodorum]